LARVVVDVVVVPSLLAGDRGCIKNVCIMSRGGLIGIAAKEKTLSGATFSLARCISRSIRSSVRRSHDTCRARRTSIPDTLWANEPICARALEDALPPPPPPHQLILSPRSISLHVIFNAHTLVYVHTSLMSVNCPAREREELMHVCVRDRRPASERERQRTALCADGGGTQPAPI
jgi:hypothetical protein